MPDHKSAKIWGQTEHIITRNRVEVHRIEAHAPHRCSLHLHKNKFNMFYVERGSMSVVVKNGDGPDDITDVTYLAKGDSIIVPPGKKHFFQALSQTVVAYEIYWIQEDSEDLKMANDIKRFIVGN